MKQGDVVRIYEVSERTTNLTESLVRIWEDSVRATHLFLSNEEIKQIKSYVPQALNEVSHLVVAENDGGAAAFMGCENRRIEMLFLAPSERGKGLGKALVQYGISHFNVREVTVNEQNPQAVGFYRHLGFKTYKRTDFDEQGNPYPLLYMKRD